MPKSPNVYLDLYDNERLVTKIRDTEEYDDAYWTSNPEVLFITWFLWFSSCKGYDTKI